MNGKFKGPAFIWKRNRIEILHNIINVFTMTFDHLNVSLLNKSSTIFLEKQKTKPNLLKG